MTEMPTPRPAAPVDLARPEPPAERVRQVPASSPAPRRQRRPAPPSVRRAAAGTRRALLVFAAAAGILLLIIGPCVAGLIWEWNRVQ